MIAKPRWFTRKRPPVPIDVRLTVSFRFGDEPQDRVTVMNDRRVPLVGSIFDSRDAVLRGFSRLLLKAGAMQPRVAAELLPLLKLLPVGSRRRQNEARPKK
jgi:hypothetical protein